MLVTKPVLQPLKALRMGKQFVANVLAFGASACVFQENPSKDAYEMHGVGK